MLTLFYFSYEPFPKYVYLLQVWRFFTYSLVHAGYEHILVNISLMLLVGLSLEMTNSWWRVATVYTLGLLTGSLLSSLLSPHTFLAGASGGVYALASAHIATIVLNWKEDSLILRQRLRSAGFVNKNISMGKKKESRYVLLL